MGTLLGADPVVRQTHFPQEVVPGDLALLRPADRYRLLPGFRYDAGDASSSCEEILLVLLPGVCHLLPQSGAYRTAVALEDYLEEEALEALRYSQRCPILVAVPEEANRSPSSRFNHPLQAKADRVAECLAAPEPH